MRTAEPQTPTAPSAPVNIKTPYWAGTEEEVQAAQVVPSRSASRRLERKLVAASKATTPTISRAPSPTPTPAASARRFSYEPSGRTYEPLTRNPYVDSCVLYWQEQVGAAGQQHGAPQRPVSPPYVPGQPAVAQPSDGQSQIRSLSPGSIFANGGTPPAPTAAKKASLTISRGIGSLRKATHAAKKAFHPQHEPKISSPVAGSFRRGIPAGHALEPQDDVAPLDLVGLDVAQADVPRFGQAELKIAATQEAARSSLRASARADAYAALTGEPTPATTPTVAAPSAPPATNPAPPKKTAPRKVVDSAMSDFFGAGMDDSWVPDPRAGLDDPEPAAAPKKPFAALVPAALKIKKLRAANNPLPPKQPTPAPSAVPKPNLVAPRPLQQPTPAPTQAPLQRPRPETPVGKSGLAAALGTRGASYLPGVTCTQCGKVVDAVAVQDHRCGKKSASDRDPQPSDWSREQFYQSNVEPGEQDGRSEVFIDTHIRPGHTSWRAGRRQSGWRMGGLRSRTPGRADQGRWSF